MLLFVLKTEGKRLYYCIVISRKKVSLKEYLQELLFSERWELEGCKQGGLGTVTCACHSQAEAGGLLRAGGQPELHSENLPQKKEGGKEFYSFTHCEKA